MTEVDPKRVVTEVEEEMSGTGGCVETGFRSRVTLKTTLSKTNPSVFISVFGPFRVPRVRGSLR